MPATAGFDDLDLDGNWAVGGEASPAVVKKKVTKAETPGKKRKLAVTSIEAPAVPKKKKRKKNAGSFVDKEDSELPGAGASPKQLTLWAASRLSACWAAEVAAAKLPPLEAKQVVPKSDWFCSCPPSCALSKLPAVLASCSSAAPARTSSVLRAIAVSLPVPASEIPRSTAVSVVCSSTERVFEVLAELQQAWVGVKPLALTCHGGGRKQAQVERQGKALAKGVAVVVGTPGRVLRLVDEGHLSAAGLGLVVLDLGRDRKQRDVLTLQETRRDFCNLLKRHLLPELGQNASTRLLLCGCGTGLGDKRQ